MPATVVETPWRGPIERAPQILESKLVVSAAFLVGLMILLLALGRTPVSRTQEARVLETARQMIEHDWRGWIVPILNGQPRLQKPPLAYWMTGISYLTLGVSERAGRIPTAIVGWVTLLATYVIARRAYDHRVAIMASGVLLGGHLFFRHMRLAETDAPATLFVTVAIGVLWHTATDRRARWFHLAAASTAMVVLAKGAPAAFVLAFFVAFCVIERRWDLFARFVRSGAPITLLVIALPWFVYVYLDQGSLNVIASELTISATGRNHFNWPVQYLPMLLVIVAPWSGFVPLALYDAVRRWRIDPATRFVLIWFGAIFLSLCLNGNKQIHYLVMLTPPLAILLARLLVAWPADLQRWNARILAGTALTIGLGAIAIPIGAVVIRHRLQLTDWLLATIVLTGVGMIVRITLRARTQAGTFALLVAVLVLLPVVEGVWIPSLSSRSMRTVANEIRSQFGDGPYVFYGPTASLTLCFEMRTVIPSTKSGEELLKLCDGGAVAITHTRHEGNRQVPPGPLLLQQQVEFGDVTFDLYRHSGLSLAPSVALDTPRAP